MLSESTVQLWGHKASLWVKAVCRSVATVLLARFIQRFGGLGVIALCCYKAVDSVALGSGSMASEPNVVSVGSGDGLRGPAVRRIVNVDDGIGNNDAVNKSQLDGVTASVNDVAASVKTIALTNQVTGSSVASASGKESTAIGSGAQAVADNTAAFGGIVLSLTLLVPVR